MKLLVDGKEYGVTLLSSTDTPGLFRAANFSQPTEAGTHTIALSLNGVVSNTVKILIDPGN